MKSKDQLLLEQAYEQILEEAYWAGSSGGVTGWITKYKDGSKWIPVETYHDDPQYIDQLEPDLADPTLKVNRKKEYNPDDYPDQEAKKDECIERGAIRVAQADLGEGTPEITIQCNSMFALNGAVSKLMRMFPKQMSRYPVTADVTPPGGKKTKSYELVELDAGGKHEWEEIKW